MIHLRSTTIAALFTFLSFFTVTYTSCNKDKCKDITCNNGGSCNDGKCICINGYMGSRCEVPDPCIGIACQNGGTCSGGACNCPAGYEGPLCETRVNQKFTGVWIVYEVCSLNGNSGYPVSITASAEHPTQISMLNLGNFPCSGGSASFTATITGNTITVDDTACNIHLSASGTINSSNSITMNYTFTDGTVTDNCSLTMTK